MKKIIVALFIMVTSIMSLTFAVSAAKINVNADGSFVASNVDIKDINRFVDVVSKTTKKDAIITNATQVNGNTWVVRLVSNNSRWDNASADYVINILPYKYTLDEKEYTSLPFKSVDDGSNVYGKSWYYFGLFDDITHMQCGICVAERLNRFPDENNLSYSNVTYRGVAYSGSYPQTSEAFLNANNQQVGLVSSGIIDTTKK